MVSRNAGWSMTDLEGEFLPKILSNQERNDFFQMLERGNWLIFQDAYPQLCLYEESKRQNKSLFYLLPYFNVSVFMKEVWEFCLRNPNPWLLTTALIINEQNYIEERVIQNPKYQQSVLDTLEFQIQDILRMNHILFPYEHHGEIKLSGATVQHFASLKARVHLGKQLHRILFSQNLDAILKWAQKHTHTASRQDFWPQVFHDKKESIPGIAYPPRFNNCSIPYNSPRFYSPKLPHVWGDVHHKPAQRGDWYKDFNEIVSFLNEQEINQDGEVKSQYCHTLEQLDLIIATKELIFDKT